MVVGVHAHSFCGAVSWAEPMVQVDVGGPGSGLQRRPTALLKSPGDDSPRGDPVPAAERWSHS